MRLFAFSFLLALTSASLVAGAVTPAATFEASDTCTVAYAVEEVPACEVEHAGVIHDASCREDPWDPSSAWCSLTWSLNGTFRGPPEVWKRLWLWQSWEGGFAAAITCEAYARAESLGCGEDHGVGVLAPLRLGECAIMRLQLIGELLPVTWPEYYYSPLGYAESETRVELCRSEDGSLPFRVL